LPAILLPRKHYVAAEIEKVVHHFLDGGKLSELSFSDACESTVRRWLKEFSQKLPQWAGLLEARIFSLSGQIPSFIRDSHPLKRLEAALTRLPPLPSWWTVMVKALWWLENSHPLCLRGPP
jgi:hypothetical protein